MDNGPATVGHRRRFVGRGGHLVHGGEAIDAAAMRPCTPDPTIDRTPRRIHSGETPPKRGAGIVGAMSELRLAGAVVGVTANHRRHDQQALLERHGATAVAAPMFRSALTADTDVLESAVQTLVEQPPDVTVLTTAFGTRSWFDVADAAGQGDALRFALGATTILARGARTAGEAVACGLDPILVETLTHSSDVADRLHALGRNAAGGRLRVAVQLDGGGDDDNAGARTPGALGGLDADVVAVPTYRWVAPDDLDAARALVEAAAQRRLDAVTFTSAPAVVHMAALAREMGTFTRLTDAFSDSVAAACVGPMSAQAAVATGWKVAAVPERPRLGAMVDALATRLADPPRLHAAGVALALRQTRVLVDGVPVPLSPTEHRLLAALLSRSNLAVAKHDLVTAVWGRTEATEHTLEAAVTALRGRLGPAGAAIRSVAGRGYTLTATTF